MRCFKVFAVASILGAFISAPRPAMATPPTPSPGTAVVDGNPGEWNLVADFFTNMYRAGDPSKPLESKAYLRYDCETHTVYVLILTEPGVPGLIIPSTQTAWVAINAQNNKVVTENSGNDGNPPDFAWIGQAYDGNPNHVLGYEASFILAPGTYNIITHIDIEDGTGAQTSASPGFPGTGPQLVLSCEPTPVETSTWSGVKALYH